MAHFVEFDEVKVLGVPVTCFASYGDIVAYVLTQIQARTPVFCVAINPLKISLAWRDGNFMRLLHRADLYLCDGVGAAIAVRLLYGRAMLRVTGVQLFFDLIAAAEKQHFSVFLLGASPESNEAAHRELRDRYPDLKIAGRHHGYFEDDGYIVDLVNASRADMLFVAMGSPKQECWISEHRDRLSVPFVMGVGGTFDVVSGKAKWAPLFFRRTGTEFIYRFYKQPQRLRCFPTIFRFTCTVLNEWIRLRGKRKQFPAS